MNAWTPEDTNLRDVLSGLYFTNQEIARIAEQARLNRGLLDFNGNLLTVWWGVVRQAKLQGKRDGLIQVALSEYPDNPVLQQAARGRLSDVRGADIEWRPTGDTPTFEKILGEQSTILPISFLEAGLDRSRSVARIVRSDGAQGSGFLIAGNLLVTNHHVLNSEDQARAAKVQFNVQRAANGLDLPSEQFDLDPAQGFLTSEVDDWTVVRIRGDANTKWGALAVKPTSIAKQGRVIIIQHPGGGPKSIALYHNIVTYADDTRVQYLTDTMPGSSGSPVFDSDWNLVAIHHSGGWLREPGSKQQLFRNEGIAVGKLLEGAQQLLI
jgi:S1-C subfamily serine protease